jgi:hypothetical protein
MVFAMRTKPAAAFLTTALAAALFSAPTSAHAEGVGLGAGVGVAVPHEGAVDFNAALNWGFFVDIPLLYTFHITPSTLLYEFANDTNSVRATDVSLNFKFIIPLGPLSVFAGLTGGLTSTNNLDPHAGVLGGLSINLISNLDVFAQVNYKIIIREDANVRNLDIFAGPLFRFY